MIAKRAMVVVAEQAIGQVDKSAGELKKISPEIDGVVVDGEDAVADQAMKADQANEEEVPRISVDYSRQSSNKRQTSGGQEPTSSSSSWLTLELAQAPDKALTGVCPTPVNPMSIQCAASVDDDFFRVFCDLRSSDKRPLGPYSG
ncbi:hypothetical protein Dimus_002617 [Dionaea muscipula]